MLYTSTTYRYLPQNKDLRFPSCPLYISTFYGIVSFLIIYIQYYITKSLLYKKRFPSQNQFKSNVFSRLHHRIFFITTKDKLVNETKSVVGDIISVPGQWWGRLHSLVMSTRTGCNVMRARYHNYIKTGSTVQTDVAVSMDAELTLCGRFTWLYKFSMVDNCIFS